MTGQQVEAALDREPYIPVRVHLDDGDAFVLAARGRVVVTPEKLLAFVSEDPYAAPEQRRLRVIPFERIESTDLRLVALPA